MYNLWYNQASDLEQNVGRPGLAALGLERRKK